MYSFPLRSASIAVRKIGYYGEGVTAAQWLRITRAPRSVQMLDVAQGCVEEQNWSPDWCPYSSSVKSLLYGPECRIDVLTIRAVYARAAYPYHDDYDRKDIIEHARKLVQSIMDIASTQAPPTINVTAVESCKHLFCGTSQAVFHSKVVLKGCGTSPCPEADKRPALVKEGTFPSPRCTSYNADIPYLPSALHSRDDLPNPFRHRSTDRARHRFHLSRCYRRHSRRGRLYGP